MLVIWWLKHNTRILFKFANSFTIFCTKNVHSQQKFWISETNKEDNDNFYFEEQSENLSEENKTLLTLHINRKEKAK